MTRRNSAKDLRRRPGRRPELATIVVFTEGAETECAYVDGLKRLDQVLGNTTLRIEIDPAHGRDPPTLVRNAAARSADVEVDQCWCLFDVEWPQHHAHLAEARALAGDHEKVHLAISNPCFELWLILHTQDRRQFLDNSEAQRLSRQLDGHSGKRIDAAWYMPKTAVAVARAQALDHWHSGNGTTFPDNNPSSGMHEFLRAIGVK